MTSPNAKRANSGAMPRRDRHAPAPAPAREDRPLGPAEAKVATELRAHRGDQPEALLASRLGLPRRTVRYWADKLTAQGFAQRAASPWPAYRWRADAPPSRYDALGPLGQCELCDALRYAVPRIGGGGKPDDR